MDVEAAYHEEGMVGETGSNVAGGTMEGDAGHDEGAVTSTGTSSPPVVVSLQMSIKEGTTLEQIMMPRRGVGAARRQWTPRVPLIVPCSWFSRPLMRCWMMTTRSTTPPSRW